MRTITRFLRQITYRKMLQNPKNMPSQTSVKMSWNLLKMIWQWFPIGHFFYQTWSVIWFRGNYNVCHNPRIFIQVGENYSIEYSSNLFYTHHLSRNGTNVSNEISVWAWLRWVGNSDFCDRLASYFIQPGIFQTESIQKIDYMISYNDAGF